MNLAQNRKFDIAIHVHKISNTGAHAIVGIVGVPQVERSRQLRVETRNDNIQLVIWTDDRLELVFKLDLRLMPHILEIGHLPVGYTGNR